MRDTRPGLCGPRPRTIAALPLPLGMRPPPRIPRPARGEFGIPSSWSEAAGGLPGGDRGRSGRFGGFPFGGAGGATLGGAGGGTLGGAGGGMLRGVEARPAVGLKLGTYVCCAPMLQEETLRMRWSPLDQTNR